MNHITRRVCKPIVTREKNLYVGGHNKLLRIMRALLEAKWCQFVIKTNQLTKKATFQVEVSHQHMHRKRNSKVLKVVVKMTHS